MSISRILYVFGLAIGTLSLVFGLSANEILVADECKSNMDASPPNILIITVDNIGYGDFTFYNKDSKILTPNLEKLVKKGALLTKFYTAGATCTVSRASLLTGRLPQRHQLVEQLSGIAGNYGIGLRQSEILIPTMLKQKEYATAAFGKWNIGFAPGSRPTERGFDEYLGIASGNADHYSHVYAGKHDLHYNTESINRHGEYSTDLFADAAIKFMQTSAQKAQPWFVYLPFDAPHHPGERNIEPGEANIWKAPQEAFAAYGLEADEKDPAKRFRAVVTAIDMAIGRLLDSLEALDQLENTFIFFYSDNGAFYPYLDIQSNAPFRGAGVTLWEGGIRVPAIACWPGHIEAGSDIDTRLWSLDLFPTCAKLSGATLPTDRFIDGKNMLPNLLDKSLKSPHATLYFEYRNFSALYWGEYKIIKDDPVSAWQLYHLSRDISEENNIAEQRSEIVKKMAAAFDQRKAELLNYARLEPDFINKR